MSSYNNVTKTDGNIRLTSFKNLALILNNIKSLLPLNLIRINKIYLFDILDSHVFYYPTPICFTYAWSFGALSGFSLVN